MPANSLTQRPAQPPAQQPEHQVEEWEINRLHEHPLQSMYFPDESAESDAEFDADLAANGQQEEIDILPDGTILGGHRRVRAAKRLGWKTVRVVVHHEFADDPAAAEAFFINDNYSRRQLTELQKARCAKRRVELAEQGQVALPEQCNALTETRDKIGWIMGKSGRHAERYLKVLEAPVEVQHALDAGHLGIVDAVGIAGLAADKQSLIAKELREQGLQNAKAIYKSHRPSKAATRRGAESIWFEFLRVLKLAKEELVGNTNDLYWLDQSDLDLIQDVEDELLTPLRIQTEDKLEEQALDEDD